MGAVDGANAKRDDSGRNGINDRTPQVWPDSAFLKELKKRQSGHFLLGLHLRKEEPKCMGKVRNQYLHSQTWLEMIVHE